MSTAQRNDDPGLIGALCREPARFTFFQAVELLLAWLADCHQVPRGEALDRLLRFENSRDLTFPTSDLGSVRITTEEAANPQAVLTNLFMGFTGTHGVLPHHYTARLAANGDNGTHAMLDVFSNRFVRHFHAAWRANRVELPSLEEGTDDLQPLLLALSGNTAGTPAEPSLAAYFTGAIQQRPASAAMLQSVLADFFQLPITVTPNIGYWHRLDSKQVNRLGTKTATLDGRLVLGRRVWRRDRRVRIRIGPLDKATFNSFLPDGANVPKLRALIAMFHMPGIDFEMVLVLKAADVRPIVLSSKPGQGFRLGYDTFLVSKAGIRDREIRYLLSANEEQP